MAQYAFDFTTIANLAAFANVGSIATSLVTEDGAQALRITESTVGQGTMLVTEAGSSILEADIIVRVRRSYTDQNNDRCAGPIIRAFGTDVNSVRGYIAGSRSSASCQVVRLLGGTARNNVTTASGAVNAATWQWQRFRIVDPGPGLTASLQVNSWTGDIEDGLSSWLINLGTTSPLTNDLAGGVGLGSMIQDSFRYTYFRELRIGTNGDAAPTGPIGGAARRRSPLLLTPW